MADDKGGQRGNNMKRVVITGERRAELVEVPDPKPKEHWVVVKIHAAPVCTEYKHFIAGEEVIVKPWE